MRCQGVADGRLLSFLATFPTPRKRASLNKVAVKWNTNKSHPAGNIIAYDQRTASGRKQEKCRMPTEKGFSSTQSFDTSGWSALSV